MIETDRLIAPDSISPQEDALERALRPKILDEYIGQEKAQTALRTLQLADIRSRLFSVDRMREGAADDYALYRDAWLQRRNYQIMSGIRDKQEQDSSLPDYLDEEIENPDVPIDAIPVIPGSP